MERTFLMIKPDAVQRNLIGEIISRIERKGLKIVGGKFIIPTKDTVNVHYAEHTEKPFFHKLVSFLTSGPVFAMVVEGENAVAVSRHIIGKTNPTEADPGTIRGDYGLTVGRNIIHGSDSVESAEREINLWFNDDEIYSYEAIRENCLYEE
ncbi:nucleoside-diphosphate kinase [Staphylococcus hominis]|uniref:nucleoside-diphosphate kinase n=1 Tax=Staphylococcus hominis TaxID=1290 RepID=UPI003DA14CD2